MTARADFLRGLPAADFCPPERSAGIATGRPPTADALAHQTAETAVAVDEFAAGYWALPPHDRRAEWERLAARPADAPTTAFLTHLKRGLTAELTAAPPDAHVGELAAMSRELFTLRPRPRSVRRMAWLDTRDGTADWPAAVGRLWTTDSTAAELDPPLVTFLDDPSAPPASVKEWGVPRAHSVNSPTYGRAHTVGSERSGYAPDRARRRQADPEPASGGSPWLGRLGIGGVLLAISIIGRIIFGCAGAGSQVPSNSPSYSPRYTPTYSPSYTMPTYTLPTYTPSYTPRYTLSTDVPPPDYFTRPTLNYGNTTIYSADEVRAFEEYRATPPPRGVMPPRYAQWLLSGRPAADTLVKPFGSR